MNLPWITGWWQALSRLNGQTQRSNLYGLSHCCIYYIWHIVLVNVLTRTSLSQGETHISKTKRTMYRKRVIHIPVNAEAPGHSCPLRIHSLPVVMPNEKPNCHKHCRRLWDHSKEVSFIIEMSSGMQLGGCLYFKIKYIDLHVYLSLSM